MASVTKCFLWPLYRKPNEIVTYIFFSLHTGTLQPITQIITPSLSYYVSLIFGVAQEGGQFGASVLRGERLGSGSFPGVGIKSRPKYISSVCLDDFVVGLR